MINSFNLCDGIDGLAAMMGIVISVCYGAIFYIVSDYLFLSFCVILVGCLLAFLRFNLPHKNKVFMGDTGSLFLGLCLLLIYHVFCDNRFCDIIRFYSSQIPCNRSCSQYFYSAYTGFWKCVFQSGLAQKKPI